MKKLVVSILLACTIFTVCAETRIYSSMIVQAAENTEEDSNKGLLAFNALYSDNITPSEEDTFLIKFIDSKGMEQSYILKSSQAQNQDDVISILPDTYKITDVIYQGNNDAIVKDGYLINTDATITEDGYCEIKLAIGRQAAIYIASTYENTIAKVDGQFVNLDTILSESDDDTDFQIDVENASDISDETEIDVENTPDISDEIETEAKVVYENEGVENIQNGRHLFFRGLPIFILAGITSVVLFLLHKNEKI